MKHYLVGGADKPLIHIDWCCLCATTGMYLLQASMSMQGRSIVIYEECHPKAKENNHATHKAFLNQLKKTLPPTASPIIVTDAGFRAIWFEYVKKSAGILWRSLKVKPQHVAVSWGANYQ